MMKAFYLENVKSFKDSGRIEIKPITIFVGPNSSGKSSLVRFPVVLSQTFKEDVTTPLLFNGHQIDYGDFEDVVYGHEEGSHIGFAIDFDLKDYKWFDQFKELFDENFIENVNMGFTIHTKIIKEENLKVKEISIYNKEIVYASFKLIEENRYNMSFYPNLAQFNYKNELGFYKFLPLTNKMRQDNTNRFQFEQVLPLYNKLESNIAFKLLSTFLPESLTDLRDHLDELGKKNTVKEGVPEFVEELKSINEDEYKKLVEVSKSKAIFEAISDMIEITNWFFTNYLNQIVYIGPFRREPERTYRFSENKILNVGNKGENSIALLGKSSKLNTNLIRKVSHWFENTMNCELKIFSIDKSLFKVIVSPINGSEEKGDNLIDVGFGISQVLPIVTQMFYDNEEVAEEYSKRFDYVPNKTFIIEQPELHLHPAAQSSLADLFVEKVTSDPTSKIILETHSEHLIRKLQVLVADPEVAITSDDIAIYYVDKDETGTSTVTQIHMNEKGQFKEKWPSGFFDKSYELARELVRVAAKPQKNGGE